MRTWRQSTESIPACPASPCREPRHSRENVETRSGLVRAADSGLCTAAQQYRSSDRVWCSLNIPQVPASICESRSIAAPQRDLHVFLHLSRAQVGQEAPAQAEVSIHPPILTAAFDAAGQSRGGSREVAYLQPDSHGACVQTEFISCRTASVSSAVRSTRSDKFKCKKNTKQIRIGAPRL